MIFSTLVSLFYKLINRSMAHNKHGSNSPFHSKHLYIGSPMVHALQTKVYILFMEEATYTKSAHELALRTCHQYIPEELAQYQPVG